MHVLTLVTVFALGVFAGFVVGGSAMAYALHRAYGRSPWRSSQAGQAPSTR
jgi:hypothetical protein